MRAKILCGAVLLLGGLAQAQPPDKWPQGFSTDHKPTLLLEPMRHDTDEEVFTSSQNSVLKMQAQQAAGVPRRVWLARYKVTIDSHIHDIAVDVAEDVYITGSMRQRANSFDRKSFTTKYNSTGVKQWEAFYNGSAHGNGGRNSACMIKLVADFDNHIYTAGWHQGLSRDYAALKYNLFGKMLWANHYEGNNSEPDFMTDFVVDNLGNVYVTGGSTGESGITEYATVKYDKTGKEQWAARYHAWYAFALALDRAGNICVTGTGSADYVTIKYNPEGVTQWVVHYNGPKNANDDAHAITVDAAGNVYVAGFSFYRDKTVWQTFATTVKYNAAGVQQWIASYPLPRQLFSDGSNLKLWVDEAGNVYLTGSGISTIKYIIIKYNNVGALQWVANYQRDNGGISKVSDMFVDGVGNVYVTGSNSRTFINQNWDYVTIKYNSAGERQWLLRYNGPQNGHDYARALAVDGSGNVYVTGESYGLGQYDIVTIKYSQSSSGTSGPASALAEIDDDEVDDAAAPEITLPGDFYLAPNYPNPFNPSTSIRFGVPQAAHVTLKVYNLLSEEVATLVDEQKPAGVHVVNFAPKNLPSGIYFYALTAGDVRLVRRMVYAK